MSTSVIPSLEIEEQILKTVIVFPELLIEVQSMIKDSAVFSSIPCRVIYDELGDLASTRTSKELESTNIQGILKHRARGHSSSEFFDYNEIFVSLFNAQAEPNSLEELCSSLLDVYFRRKLNEILQSSLELNQKKDSKTEEVLSTLESQIYELNQERSGALKDWRVKTGDTLDQDWEGSLDAFLDAPVQGLKTGLADLDSLTMGLHPRQISIWAGRPAMGKTSSVVHIANAIATQDKPVVFFSQEMDALQLDLKRLSNLSKIDSKKFIEKNLTPQERAHAADVWRWMQQHPLIYDANPSATLSTIRSTMRKYTNEYGNVPLFIVDYLQLLGGGGENNRNNELDFITRQLRIIAKEFDSHGMLLSQLSRAVESRANKRPQMSDLRDSGAIEQHADIIVGLYRDEYYDPQSVDRNVTEFIIEKNRNGPTGTAKILSQLEISNYENLARF